MKPRNLPPDFFQFLPALIQQRHLPFDFFIAGLDLRHCSAVLPVELGVSHALIQCPVLGLKLLDALRELFKLLLLLKGELAL